MRANKSRASTFDESGCCYLFCLQFGARHPHINLTVVAPSRCHTCQGQQINGETHPLLDHGPISHVAPAWQIKTLARAETVKSACDRHLLMDAGARAKTRAKARQHHSRAIKLKPVCVRVCMRVCACQLPHMSKTLPSSASSY